MYAIRSYYAREPRAFEQRRRRVAATGEAFETEAERTRPLLGGDPHQGRGIGGVERLDAMRHRIEGTRRGGRRRKAFEQIGIVEHQARTHAFGTAVVITSYSIHYTKLYESPQIFSGAR